jgi:hypothetical protein
MVTILLLADIKSTTILNEGIININIMALYKIIRVMLFIIISYNFMGCRTTDYENGCDVNKSENYPEISYSPSEQFPEESDTDFSREGQLFVLGRCEYKGFRGKARIISIDIINSYEIDIILTFQPDNDEERESYKFSDFPDNQYRKKIYISADEPEFLITDAGTLQNDSREIKSGDELECFRLEIVKGTCTPVVFVLPEIEKIDNSNF